MNIHGRFGSRATKARTGLIERPSAWSGRLAGVFFALSTALAGAEQPVGVDTLAVSPRPQVELVGDGFVALTKSGGPVRVSTRGASLRAPAVRAGVELLSVRLRQVGARFAPADDRSAALTLLKISADQMGARLSEKAGENPGGKRRDQAYLLESGGGRVTVTACSDLGLYYGLLSLIQIVGSDQENGPVVRAVTIADWPQIACRLAKTSASSNPPEKVAAFAAWLPLMKMNLIGLQYHGSQSKDPEPPFTRSIETLCPRFRREGVLESIVYFCPFRGRPGGAAGEREEAYDMSRESDRRAYADFLRWIMTQGAHGIEVDYNDWPGSPEVPIADVINSACAALEAEHPDAYVLYCPPAAGRESYRGMATEQLGRTLSSVPTRVWPLWTGMQTLITSPLETEQVERWTQIAGRRPFLWVNRVSLGVPKQFARRLPGDGGYVFCGEYLPKDLNRWFEGVHFNAGISGGYNELRGEFEPRSMAYLATAADYVWNPRHWDAAESARRARRFVAVMGPLLRAARGPDDDSAAP